MSAGELRDSLRQMLVVLQSERQALAALDLDAILATAVDKRELCGRLDSAGDIEIDAECHGLLDAAKRINETNRQVRNLIAANVGARLEALTGTLPLYQARPAYAYAGATG
jgi:hypothetical protein